MTRRDVEDMTDARYFRSYFLGARSGEATGVQFIRIALKVSHAPVVCKFDWSGGCPSAVLRSRPGAQPERIHHTERTAAPLRRLPSSRLASDFAHSTPSSRNRFHASSHAMITSLKYAPLPETMSVPWSAPALALARLRIRISIRHRLPPADLCRSFPGSARHSFHLP